MSDNRWIYGYVRRPEPRNFCDKVLVWDEVREQQSCQTPQQMPNENTPPNNLVNQEDFNTPPKKSKNKKRVTFQLPKSDKTPTANPFRVSSFCSYEDNWHVISR